MSAFGYSKEFLVRDANFKYKYYISLNLSVFKLFYFGLKHM